MALMVLAQPALAEKVSLGCVFDKRCQPNIPCRDEEMRLRIDYDTNGGAALVIGDIGSRKAEVHPGPEVISFIETLADGLVLVTSVQAVDGKSVQTMHRVIRGVLYPTQYLGFCNLLQ